MATPAYIVEGDQEKAIVQRLCRGLPVKLLGANGRDVPLFKIAENIKRITESLNNRNFPIIVIFDRENRAESGVEILNNIKQYLDEMKCDSKQYIFGIPDRKFESWILPFVDLHGDFHDIPSKGWDGKSSLGEVERRFRTGDRIYNKVLDGPKIFCRVKANKLAEISPSFNLFYVHAKKHCGWMR